MEWRDVWYMRRVIVTSRDAPNLEINHLMYGRSTISILYESIAGE